MTTYKKAVIKSFKHDGHLHRMWLENWIVPSELLHPAHAAESMIVVINCQTPIREASGETWISKVPGVSFFIPNAWYNIVALMETSGVRYYCNAASPPHLRDDVLTYIDYDLDVVVMPDGTYQILDQAEFDHHRTVYRYSGLVEKKVKQGLKSLLDRVQKKRQPFHDEIIHDYYNRWLHDVKDMK